MNSVVVCESIVGRCGDTCSGISEREVEHLESGVVFDASSNWTFLGNQSV